MILGGDVAGKAIQSIVRAPGGHWQCRFVGTDYDVVEGPELTALEKLIADHGYYPYRADPGELEAKEADGGLDDAVPRSLMRERLTEWLELADARLRPLGIPLYFMLGNDDPEELGALLDSAPWGTHDEGKVVWLDDEHEMISCGYSNVDALAHLSRAGRDPPSGLDRRDGAHAASIPSERSSTCTRRPSARSSTRPRSSTRTSHVQASLGQVQMVAVGSTAVRDAEQTYQPLLGLHGHIHEFVGHPAHRPDGRPQPGQRLLDRGAERRADHARRRQGQGTAAGPRVAGVATSTAADRHARVHRRRHVRRPRNRVRHRWRAAFSRCAARIRRACRATDGRSRMRASWRSSSLVRARRAHQPTR